MLIERERLRARYLTLLMRLAGTAYRRSATAAASPTPSVSCIMIPGARTHIAM
jgi:hypothetical protein